MGRRPGRRLRVQPRRRPLPLLPARRLPARRHPHLPRGRGSRATRSTCGRSRCPADRLFAWESPTWGGGIAFHQADAGGTTLARAYLVTVRQFAACWSRRCAATPGPTTTWRRCWPRAGTPSGRAATRTLHLVGELDDRPVLTFSTPDVAALGLRPPARAYLATLARGLRAAHDLSLAETVDYLLSAGMASGPASPASGRPDSPSGAPAVASPGLIAGRAYRSCLTPRRPGPRRLLRPCHCS